MNKREKFKKDQALIPLSKPKLSQAELDKRSQYKVLYDPASSGMNGESYHHNFDDSWWWRNRLDYIYPITRKHPHLKGLNEDTLIQVQEYYDEVEA